MNIRFSCPVCAYPARLTGPGPGEWVCPNCDHALRIEPDAVSRPTAVCPICANAELYKKKDFPHWLGLTILALASLTFVVGHGLYWPRLAWAFLIGSAIVDGVLYLTVRDVVVCYRCAAHCRGLGAVALAPFDLGVAERYRQERIRRAQFEAGKRSGS